MPSGKVIHSAGNYDLDVFSPFLGVTPRLRFNTGIDYGLNAFDAIPPAVYNSALTYTDPSYDFVGRYIWGRIVQKF